MYLNPSKSLDSWPAVIGFCGLAIGIQVVLGGVRPVDGSILAQFAKNGFNSQVTAFAEYLFDSPLKILFLRTLGIQSPALIALAFIALTFLPFATAFLASAEDTRKTCLVLLAALPISRIAFASIGIGDSLLFAGAVAIIVSPARSISLLSAVIMTTWHVQQGLIVLCLLAGLFFLCGDVADKRKVPYVVIGLVGGVLAYFLVRLLLMPQYHGRADFLMQHIDRFLLRMLFYWPVAFAVALPGLLALWLAKGRDPVHWSVWSALVAAFLVSAITSDVSRVFFILGFPVILFAIIKYGAAPSVRQLQVLLPVLALSSVVPLLGWTGVEIFDWKGLANAMIKYGETSNIPKLFLQLRQPYE